MRAMLLLRAAGGAAGGGRDYRARREWIGGRIH